MDRFAPSLAFDDLKNILKFYFIRQGKGIFCEGILAGTEKKGKTGGEEQKEGDAEQECDRTMLLS